MFISTDFVEESSQNECEEKKEMRQAQTPVNKTGMYRTYTCTCVYHYCCFLVQYDDLDTLKAEYSPRSR